MLSSSLSLAIASAMILSPVAVFGTPLGFTNSSDTTLTLRVIGDEAFATVAPGQDVISQLDGTAPIVLDAVELEEWIQETVAKLSDKQKAEFLINFEAFNEDWVKVLNREERKNPLEFYLRTYFASRGNRDEKLGWYLGPEQPDVAGFSDHNVFEPARR